MSLSLGIGFAMVAALTTASSHAMLKSGNDQSAVRALCGAVWAAAAIIPLLIVGLPDARILPWLIGAVILHTIYSMVLTRSYTLNDFSIAFPIARGTAPLVAGVGGLLVFQEALSPLAVTGIMVISLGILSLAGSARIGQAGLTAAISAGFLTAAYTIVDAGGMRASDGILPFLSWFFFATGLALVIQYRLTIGPSAFARMRQDLRTGTGAGLLAVVSFGSTLVALRYAPIAIVSALRETCILVGILIAWFWMKERVTPRTLTAAMLITTGILSLMLSKSTLVV